MSLNDLKINIKIMLEFFALISISFIISNQIVPLEQFKTFLSNYFNKRIISTKKWFKFVRTYLNHLFSCNACISFWLILIFMGSWELAVIGYLISCFIGRHLSTTSL